VAPSECTVMVEFHQKSTCGDAANLTNYLNSRGISTSCNGMSLQDDTEDRVITCQYFVMLITKGYQESKEYQDKFNNNYQKFQDIHNTNVTITAVIDEDCNKECEFSSNHWLTRVKLRSAQQVFKETSPNWMEEIESIISKSIGMYFHMSKQSNSKTYHYILILFS
jgi:hypothetical protein